MPKTTKKARRADRASPQRFWSRALAHRNYRLFFVGQGISLVGTWMTRLATLWLVYRLAGEQAALLLGLVGFAGQIPMFLLAPIAGVLVDRWDSYRLLLVTQVLSLLQSAALAWVAFRGEPGAATLYPIVALSLFQGVINAFDMPARQVLLVEIVERRDDLPNAIALNSFLVNGGRLVGPALAGAVVALIGEGWCFTIDAVSFVAVIIALLRMTHAATKAKPEPGPLRRRMVEGFRYAFGFAPIRALLLLLAAVSFLGMPYTVLMPIFASDVLGGDAYMLGFLNAAAGLGALIGAAYLASRRSVLGLGRVIVGTTMVFGLSLAAFGLSRWPWLSLALMLATGFGLMVQLAATNTILQTIVESDKRGRVMSFYGMAFLGMAPFGSLFAGVMASRLGAPATVTLCGCGCLLAGLAFALQLGQLRTHIRPIYRRLGILPEIAGGMQTAAELTSPPQD